MAWVIPSSGQDNSAWTEREMSLPRERIPDIHRLKSVVDFARMRSEGRAIRGAHCLAVVVRTVDEPVRIAFVASRRGVGGAVQRNRARRRLREIVRRRWPQMIHQGWWLMFVAFRSTLTAPHEELVMDVERILTRAGALPVLSES